MVRLSKARGKRLLPVQVPYRAHIRRICTGRVLDVGCGIGRNLAHIGDRAVGVDHNSTAVAVARSRGLRAYDSAEFVDSPDAETAGYDTLLLAHVLEHMSASDGEQLLAAYLPFLRPGGRLVVICPQERGYGSDSTHVRFMGFGEIAQMCRRAGLLVRRQYSFPLPRLAGRLFTHNEFVLLADKATAILA